MSRRGFLKSAAALVIAGASTAAYARWVEPTWVEVTRADLPVPRLPPAWEGARLVHISDLHVGDSVPYAYLERALGRAMELEPDLVAATGDFATHPSGSYGQAVTRLVARLTPPLGVFACLGNHEYGLRRPQAGAAPYPVVEDIRQSGARVLRNEAVRLSRSGEDLWVAGMDDLWPGRLDPAAAMAEVPPGSAHVTLCHNPDGADACAGAGCGAILSGHTHGGQVNLPFIGAPFVPVVEKSRYAGFYRVGGATLYINRGLGWILRVRFACRPEIALLTLRRAP